MPLYNSRNGCGCRSSRMIGKILWRAERAYKYLHRRFVQRTHIVDTKLAPGDFHSTDTLLLHASFEVLVNFVERECASMYNYCFSTGTAQGSREKGIAYLSASFVTRRDQTVMDLYHWWVDERPARPDHWDTIWGAADRAIQKPVEEYTREDFNIIDKAKDECCDLDDRYEAEDQEKLVQLISIRDKLWT